MIYRNLTLIGMPASGKSTLGVLTAKALGWDFLDTDVLIQAREGRTLKDIIANDGVPTFRALESRTICGLDVSHCVVAPGGSVVFEPQSMSRLQQLGLIVWLHVSLSELARRIGNLAERGVIHRTEQTLADILAEREPLYRRYAQRTVVCDGKSHEQLVDELVRSVLNEASI